MCFNESCIQPVSKVVRFLVNRIDIHQRALVSLLAPDHCIHRTRYLQDMNEWIVLDLGAQLHRPITQIAASSLKSNLEACQRRRQVKLDQVDILERKPFWFLNELR